MHEREIKTIVEAVMAALAEKGLIAEGQKRGHDAPVNVTTGTAGKVFSSEEWQPRKGSTSCPTPSGHACASGGGGCPGCESACKTRPTAAPISANQLRDIGADRIAACHPTKSCTEIASYVDHTMLKAVATQEEIAKLCEEARNHHFASVCVNPSYVAMSAKLLRGSDVKVCTVVGFPLGSTTPTVKAIEARDAMANGAEEIDMVINVGALKSGNDALVRGDIQAVRDATRGRVLKVILETALLTDDEKVRACRISKEVGADFVKTSTGFGPGGATVEDVKLMRETVGPMMGVKASGGIRDTAMAQQMIAAGATRLGTSASVAIVTNASTEPMGQVEARRPFPERAPEKPKGGTAKKPSAY